MKNYYLTFVLCLLALINYAQTPCENNMAGDYPCNGFDILSFISLEELDTDRGNDSWGWTDPQDGKEYGIMGVKNGTVFVDMSDPINPIYLGKIPTHTETSIWRDIKVYNNYAFIVSEADGHGMQIFDLTRLRNVANPPEIFTVDAHYDGFGGSHNIVINEATGFAYSVGDDTYSGGAHFIDISDPLNPTAAGGYADDGYTHDAQVVIYNGPDSDYTGREIYFACNEDKVVVVDVTDKNNPQHISSLVYTNYSYTHQGWLTEDQRYFLVGDEADEIDFGFNTKTIVLDLNDLDNPTHSFDYSGPTLATDHNGYVKGNTFYLANNAAGMRVIDLSDIENENINEIGYLDTRPINNNAGYEGIWSLYPYFESGNILLSDREGLFIVRESNLSVNDSNTESEYTIYPNPTNNFVTIQSINQPLNSIEIYDTQGKLLFSEKNTNLNQKSINLSSFTKGVYFLIVNDITKKLVKN